MKTLALQVAALSIALAGSASAADMRLPTKAPAPAPVAVAYSWTGCYVGAGGGYGLFDQEVQYFEGGPVGSKNDVGGRGWFGTVQVGCDYQIGSNIVIGAFGDYDFSGIKGTWSSNIFEEIVGREKHKSSWAAGGRIGWVPWASSQFMWFVSGGYTQARFDAFNLVDTFSGVQVDGLSVAKHTYDGWFIGTGYEYGIGWLPGLFWKTEYRFADYGKESVALLRSGFDTGAYFEQRKIIHTVRSELVWRFNFGGPVVARY